MSTGRVQLDGEQFQIKYIKKTAISNHFVLIKNDSDYLAVKETTWSYSKFFNCPAYLCKPVPLRSQQIQICCTTITNMQTELQYVRLYKKCVTEKRTKYTKSLVNTNLVYTNFTNTHFQKVPIPHLTRTMKQKFLH